MIAKENSLVSSVVRSSKFVISSQYFVRTTTTIRHRSQQTFRKGRASYDKAAAILPCHSLRPEENRLFSYHDETTQKFKEIVADRNLRLSTSVTVRAFRYRLRRPKSREMGNCRLAGLPLAVELGFQIVMDTGALIHRWQRTLMKTMPCDPMLPFTILLRPQRRIQALQP